MEGVIIRFVFDEAHKIFTDIVFRDVFGKVSKLASFAVLKIFLSATMPPELEPEFIHEASMPNSLLFIRAPTSRPNLRYNVIQVENRVRHIHEVALALAHHLEVNTFKEDSRGIIYCASIEATNIIAERLGNCKSHSDMQNAERLHCQNVWYAGEKKWIVATSGFIHGIDHHDVKAIIFVESPYGAINIEQGAGRAGRNGEPANIYLLNSTNIHNLVDPRANSDPQCIKVANEFVRRDDRCRRYIMTSLMDGRGVECRDLEGALECDTCDPDEKLFQVAKMLTEEDEEHAPVPTNRSGGSDDFSDVLNDGTWDDESLMLVDSDLLTDHHASGGTDQSRNKLRALPTAPNTATHHSLTAATAPTRASHLGTVHSTAPTASSSHSRSVTVATTVTIPSNNRPSMGVEIEAAIYNSQMAVKKAKIEVLTEMTRFLLGKCFVCWARAGNPNVPKTPDHNFFFSCRLPHERFITNGGGWMTLKKRIRFKVPYSHCYRCGLPQGELMPATHPEFVAGKTMVCPLEDFTAVLAWAVFMDENLFGLACRMFRGIKPKMKTEEFYAWANEGEGPENFYNALELVIWLWKFRQVR
jgi:superfamily II DNA/RNA helicase